MYIVLLLLKTICITLFTGSLVYVVVVVIPTYREIPLYEFPLLHRRMDDHARPYMPLMVVLTGALALVELFFDRYTWQFICNIYCIIGIFFILLFSQLHNVPLNHRFREWTPSSQDDIFRLRNKWIFGYYIRTAIAATVYIAVIIVPLIIQYA